MDSHSHPHHSTVHRDATFEMRMMISCRFLRRLLDAWSLSLDLSWTKGDTDGMHEEQCTQNMDHLEKKRIVN